MLRYELCTTQKGFHKTFKSLLYEGCTVELDYVPVTIKVYQDKASALKDLDNYSSDIIFKDPYYLMQEYWVEEDDYDQAGKIQTVHILKMTSFEDMVRKKLTGREWGDLDQDTKTYLLKKAQSDKFSQNIGLSQIDLSVSPLYAKGFRLNGGTIMIPDDSVIQCASEHFR